VHEASTGPHDPAALGSASSAGRRGGAETDASSSGNVVSTLLSQTRRSLGPASLGGSLAGAGSEARRANEPLDSLPFWSKVDAGDPEAALWSALAKNTGRRANAAVAFDEDEDRRKDRALDPYRLEERRSAAVAIPYDSSGGLGDMPDGHGAASQSLASMPIKTIRAGRLRMSLFLDAPQ
jgi:hypothetical protein